MSNALIRTALLHALTEYDRKQASKPGYNRYALPQYIARLNEIMADIEHGSDLRAAINAGFSGRLATACLKAVGQRAITMEEARGGYIYRPVAGIRAEQEVGS